MRPDYTPKDIQRFWSKVAIADPDDCWEWMAGKFPTGYGLFQIKGKCSRAHRLAYELGIGPISDGLCVCHHCDNPACCNPAHLWLGTHLDNMRDMKAKGRLVILRGIDHGNHKLTEGQVHSIRALYAQGRFSQHELAQLFDIDQQVIWAIVNNKRWTHVK